MISAKALELAVKYHTGHFRLGKEPQINHAKRVAHKAIFAEQPELIVAAAYLHDVLDMNRDIYHDIFLEIQEIDKDLARIVDKFAKKDYESWDQYYKRICMVNEAKYILLLDHLDNIPDVDSETQSRMLSNLYKLVG